MNDQAEDGDAECAAGLLSGSGDAGGPALPSNGYVAEAYRINDGEHHRRRAGGPKYEPVVALEAAGAGDILLTMADIPVLDRLPSPVQ